MSLQSYEYRHGDVRLIGQIALPEGPGPHPAILVMNDARGLGALVRERAERLAGLGYVALATDMYGEGALYANALDGGAVMQALHAEPDKLRERIHVHLDALRGRDEVDATRIAAIGFCFGGECVLDLARSGADVRAVVSYHGLLTTERPAPKDGVKAHVAIYAGGNDPYAPPEHIEGFRDEMAAAAAVCDVTVFGDAFHSFTDPTAREMTNIPGVKYDPVADRVSWLGTVGLLEETMGASS
ncbi:dienelactone hydrolase family protein [soil metagenome]